jgi:DNA-binding NarL/FixJ family response regulator
MNDNNAARSEKLGGVQLTNSSPQVAYAHTSGSAGCVASVTVVIAVGLASRFAGIFAEAGQVELIGVCDPIAEMPRKLARLNPDVLLLDGDVEQPALLRLLRAVQTPPYAAKPLIATDRCDREFIGMILRHGARGCLRSASSDSDVLKAILAVESGDIWLERKLLAKALTGLIGERSLNETADSTNSCLLTIRESSIVALLVKGLTNKEIAKELDVSVETVKKHLKSIFSKLGVRSRTQVVLNQLSDRILMS